MTVTMLGITYLTAIPLPGLSSVSGYRFLLPGGLSADLLLVDEIQNVATPPDLKPSAIVRESGRVVGTSFPKILDERVARDAADILLTRVWNFLAT